MAWRHEAGASPRLSYATVAAKFTRQTYDLIF